MGGPVTMEMPRPISWEEEILLWQWQQRPFRVVQLPDLSFTGTGNTRGAGYQYAPQVIISGGGWRKVGAANPNNVIKDGEILEATEGIVIIRKNSNGILTYFKPKNPFN